MIKKIICPVDFGSASMNAVQYAANLAKILDAKILFMTVQRLVPVLEPVGEHLKKENKEQAPSLRLRALSADVAEKFGIETDFEVVVTTLSLERTMAGLSGSNTLMVVGSNGIDDFFQYFFGTNAYHIVRIAKCPVWIVPENEAFRKISDVIFAWDYTSGNLTAFKTLASMMKTFHPKFRFLHVSEDKTVISQDVFRAMKERFIEAIGENTSVTFQQLFMKDIPDALEDQLTEEPTDLLVLTSHDRGPIRNMFHGTIIKKIVEKANIPVLLLQS